ncbi:hypothetical protein [Streptomyces sp. NPDC058145]
MLETIALHEPLEAKNEFFAWLVAETFLSTNGVAAGRTQAGRPPAT